MSTSLAGVAYSALGGFKEVTGQGNKLEEYLENYAFAVVSHACRRGRTPHSTLFHRNYLWFGHRCSGDHMPLEHSRNYGLGMDALVAIRRGGGCCRGRRMDIQRKTPCVMAAVMLRPWKVRKHCSCHAGHSRWAQADFFFALNGP